MKIVQKKNLVYDIDHIYYRHLSTCHPLEPALNEVYGDVLAKTRAVKN